MLEPLLRHVPAAVWRCDRALRVTSVHAGPRDWHGQDPRAWVGASVAQLLGISDESDRRLGVYRAALAGTGGEFRDDFQGRCHRIEVEPLCGDGRVVEGCVTVALDITERIEAQGAVARSEARLDETQRIAHVGTWTWEVAGDVVTWSDELHRIY